MTRTVHLMAGAAHGGAELFFERLVAGLGPDTLPIIRRDAPRLARLRAAGLAPRIAPFAGPLDILSRPLLARRLRAFAPRVTVAWMGRAAAHAPRGDWVLVGRLGGAYPLHRFRRCDHLVANTAALADWIAGQGWPAGRAHVLPNFAPDHLAGSVVPAPLGPGPLVLAMGRLHRNKGFDVLLAAMARLPGVRAAIAGEGPERAALEALARQAGLADRVIFLGWRDDIAALLAAADLLVCSSRLEPLGNVVLDGFAAARPVVAAAAAGPAALIDSGRNGILVPVDSAVALAAGIEGVLADPDRAAALAAAGRATWDARFAAPVVLGAWQHFLATVEKP